MIGSMDCRRAVVDWEALELFIKNKVGGRWDAEKRWQYFMNGYRSLESRTKFKDTFMAPIIDEMSWGSYGLVGIREDQNVECSLAS